MAYDEALVDRIRGLRPRLSLLPGEEVGEMRMFGGLCFTLGGKMLVGVGKGRLMVRIGTEELEAALAERQVDPMDFTGKPLRNFAYVVESAYASDDELISWIEGSARFVRTHVTSKPRRKKA